MVPRHCLSLTFWNKVELWFSCQYSIKVVKCSLNSSYKNTFLNYVTFARCCKFVSFTCKAMLWYFFFLMWYPCKIQQEKMTLYTFCFTGLEGCNIHLFFLAHLVFLASSAVPSRTVQLILNCIKCGFRCHFPKIFVTSSHCWYIKEMFVSVSQQHHKQNKVKQLNCAFFFSGRRVRFMCTYWVWTFKAG